jgi:hypothetical protein
MPDIYVITREYMADEYYRFKVLDQYYLNRDIAVKRLYEKVNACEKLLNHDKNIFQVNSEKTDICCKVVSDSFVMGHEERIFRLEKLSQYEEES